MTDNQIDAATGTIRLKARIREQGPRACGRASPSPPTSRIGVDKDALTVPTAAIQHGQKGLFVYVVDDQNRAALRNR